MSEFIYAMFSSFVGSKKYWIKELQKYKDESFVEPFCGSAVLSFNLAKDCVLNDIDSKLITIIKYFDKQIVEEPFTPEKYFKARKEEEWWKYAYCLQHMSFSGVFRYGKNGYNVPIKKGIKEIKEINVYSKYIINLERWKKIKKKIFNKQYHELKKELFIDKVVILDPPYQNSQASYNSTLFNYQEYWKWVEEIKKISKVVIFFDTDENLIKQNIPIYKTRKMRINGKYKGAVEAMSIYENKKWLEREEEIKEEISYPLLEQIAEMEKLNGC